MSLLTRHHRTICGRQSLLLAAIAIAAPGALAGGERAVHDCVRSNELWFTTADGVRLVGHRFGGLRPGTRPAVVLAHQSNGSLCEWLAEAARRARRLGPRLRPRSRLLEGSRPLRPARDGLRRRGTGRAVPRRAERRPRGASLGGIAAVVAGASVTPPVAGIAALSAPATIAGRVDARPFAPRLAVPTLYVAARGDQSPPYDFAADAQRLYDTTGAVTKRLELVEGSDHGVALVERSPAIRALLERFVRDPSATVGG